MAHNPTTFNKMLANKNFCEKQYHHANNLNAKIIFSVCRVGQWDYHVYSELELIELKQVLEKVINQLNAGRPIQLL